MYVRPLISHQPLKVCRLSFTVLVLWMFGSVAVPASSGPRRVPALPLGGDSD